jgi:hypothetical protein
VGPLDLEQRWLSRQHAPGLDRRLDEADQQGQQARPDVLAVDVRGRR